jgi:N-acetylgalactosamine-N,N'-diacetylbacillosaminyl-diphospho-undecaprenol 4-alpha-N-acetylgalactosaminyltransferase
MEIHKKKLKIAIIGDSLSGGGSEKVHGLLSCYFEEAGHKVSNCIFDDKIDYLYSGSLLNLGKINNGLNKFIRKVIVIHKFRNFIYKSNFDIIIDFRVRLNPYIELIYSQFVYPKNTIYTIHSGFLNYYFPENKFLSHFLHKRHHLVCVSKAIKEKIMTEFSLKKITTIYNPIDLEEINKLKNQFEIKDDYILLIGSMNNEIKQIDQAIYAYSKTDLPNQKIKLMILGEGHFKKKYIKLVENLNLNEMVHFKGFVKNPFPYLKCARYLILTSKNEGFPNAIIESLSCQTPVISFNCFSGPNEVILNNFNGKLVENQNFESLTKAMNEMVFDEKLYAFCVKNTLSSVLQFDLKKIGFLWNELFIDLKTNHTY